MLINIKSDQLENDTTWLPIFFAFVLKCEIRHGNDRLEKLQKIFPTDFVFKHTLAVNIPKGPQLKVKFSSQYLL